MSLQLIYGTALSKRTGEMYRIICEQARKTPKFRYLYLVPEQATLQVQRELVYVHPEHVLSNIDVLSFHRLAYRIFDELSLPAVNLLDDTGKAMILRRVASNCRDQMQIFGKNLDQAGFISKLKSVISELTQYGISTEQLGDSLSKLGKKPLLSRKLGDILLIYEQFRKELGETYITAEELLAVLCKVVSRSSMIADSILIFDGFTGFTPLQYQLMELLMQKARHVICGITIGSDCIQDGRVTPEQTWNSLFDMSRKMSLHLKRLAEEHQIDCGDEYNHVISAEEVRPEEIRHMEQELFRIPYKSYNKTGPDSAIHLINAESISEEVHYVLRQTCELIRTGYQYRDIAIVAGDLSVYQYEITRQFSEMKIPYFIDQNKNLKDHPAVRLIEAVLTLTEENMSYDSMMYFLKNPFMQFPEEQRNILDNYVLANGIGSVKRWHEVWERPCRGMTNAQVEECEKLRMEILELTDPVMAVLKGNGTIKDGLAALYDLLRKLQVQEQMKAMAEDFGLAGELERQKEYEQSYEKMLGLFDQMAALMGEEELKTETLKSVLQSGFEELKVGVIPSAIDRLVVGDLTRTRTSQIKVLFIIGINDKQLPKITENSGVLTEYDREYLKDAGIELAPTAKEDAFNQRYYVYLTLSKPSEALYLSYSRTGSDQKEIRPSYLIGAIRRLYPSLEEKSTEHCFSGLDGMVGKKDGYRLLIHSMRSFLDGDANDFWPDLYSFYTEEPEYAFCKKELPEALFYSSRMESLDQELARRLYGKNGQNQVTKLEKYASCAYAHFLSSALELEPRIIHQLRAADYGTIFHQALSNFFHSLHEKQLAWRELPPDVCAELVRTCVDAAIEQCGNTVFESSARNQYARKRVLRIMDRTIWALGKQWNYGSYSELLSELSFHRDQKNAIALPLQSGITLALEGRIDRLDISEENHAVYVKIIDYKSGSTSFDIAKIYQGIQLQLILYLQAAIEMEQKHYPDKPVIPAGIYYYNIKDPIVDGPFESEESKEKAILKELQMNGLTNSDETALGLIDQPGFVKSSVVKGLERKKDGALSARAQTAETSQMKELCQFGRKKAAELANAMFRGEIPLNPVDYGHQTTACSWCEYRSVCRFDVRVEGCQHKRMPSWSREELWDRIMKAVQKAETETL